MSEEYLTEQQRFHTQMKKTKMIAETRISSREYYYDNTSTSTCFITHKNKQE